MSKVEWMTEDWPCLFKGVKDRAEIIRTMNAPAYRRQNQATLTEDNFDEMMERADALSREKLGQPLGPFWRAYDTPCSGWNALRVVLCGSKRLHR